MSQLLITFERWWQLGEVPETGRVGFFFRKVMKENPESYKVVSFTLIPGKMLEQTILKAIAKHKKNKKIIRSGQ